jgi:hypothetical protein
MASYRGDEQRHGELAGNAEAAPISVTSNPGGWSKSGVSVAVCPIAPMKQNLATARSTARTMTRSRKSLTARFVCASITISPGFGMRRRAATSSQSALPILPVMRAGTIHPAAAATGLPCSMIVPRARVA